MSVEAWKAFFEWGTVVLVGFTFVFGAGALITGNILGDRKEMEIAQLKKDAGEANEKAGTANERAGKLENANLGLRWQVATLETNAAKQRERAAIAEMRLQQEIPRREPRHLTDEQKDTLVSELKGKISQIALVVQRDLESKRFALQLEIALQEAGAKIIEFPMEPGETIAIPGGILMYKPGGVSDEQGLKDDPVYVALKRANLLGGTAAKPFSSLEKGPFAAMLPADSYILYIDQKTTKNK